MFVFLSTYAESTPSKLLENPSHQVKGAGWFKGTAVYPISEQHYMTRLLRLTHKLVNHTELSVQAVQRLEWVYHRQFPKTEGDQL